MKICDSSSAIAISIICFSAPSCAWCVAQEKRKGQLLGVRIEVWGGEAAP
jgi:hypothetical protein